MARTNFSPQKDSRTRKREITSSRQDYRSTPPGLNGLLPRDLMMGGRNFFTPRYVLSKL